MTRQREASARGLAVWGLVALAAWCSGCQAVETRPTLHEFHYEQGGM
jgi:hypothetical protein